MTLFTEDRFAVRRRGPRARSVGWVLLVLALVGIVAFGLTPSPYVIEQPGPVFNTIGKVTLNGDKTVQLIEITGAQTYPTSGTLDMLTVNLVGNRDQMPSWLDVAQALVDPSKAVLPIDAVYPTGVTVKQSDSQSTVEMQNSQRDAIAAALSQLGYSLPTVVTIGGLTIDSPAKDILETGDTVVSVNGETATSVAGLRAIIAKTGAGKPVSIVILRGGVQRAVTVTPQLSTDPTPVPIVGIYPAISYDFPFDVKISVGDVGGPSAGAMLALGIIDKLTPGELNGGAAIAGTGTIDAAGTIGAIGGIRQKMYGAKAAGAKWFLAPASNCKEVTGHIPSGITVLSVATLSQSLAAVKAIGAGESTAALPHCPAN